MRNRREEREQLEKRRERDRLDSQGLMRLRPVKFRYKKAHADGSKPIDYGVIAEEVAAIYPDLVVRDADGKVETVQYQTLTPMLLNELQREHARGEKQAEEIHLLKERLTALESFAGKSNR